MPSKEASTGYVCYMTGYRLSKCETELLTMSHDSTQLMIDAEADKGLK